MNGNSGPEFESFNFVEPVEKTGAEDEISSLNQLGDYDTYKILGKEKITEDAEREQRLESLRNRVDKILESNGIYLEINDLPSNSNIQPASNQNA
ncbi:MAG: hypothetical protein WCJ86_02905 [Candidatus Saccharibacteria bacterium]